jgi:hypothetical protein
MLSLFFSQSLSKKIHNFYLPAFLLRIYALGIWLFLYSVNKGGGFVI